MAESTSLNLTALQAIITWVGTDGQTNLLYRKDDNPTLQVALDVRYTKVQRQSEGHGFFRIRVPVDLKALPREKTPLFLYIRPERVVSVRCQQTDNLELPAISTDELIRAKLGPQTIHLSFILKSPADMVVPNGVPLVPTKRKPHGEQIHSLTSLARTTSFCVFLKVQDLGSTSLLRDFADAIGDPTRAVHSTAEADDVLSLYSGHGGRILDHTELSADESCAASTLPPSYDSIEAGPPVAPLEFGHKTGEPSTSAGSRKRRRDSEGEESRVDLHTDTIYKDIKENMFRQFREEINDVLHRSRQEDRAYMTTLTKEVVTELVRAEIKTLKTDIMAEIQSKKMEMERHLEMCTSELDCRLRDAEREIEEMNDRVDVQVDDAVLDYKLQVEEEMETFKSEMRDFVAEQLDETQETATAEVEDRVMDRLRRATVVVEQATIELP